MRKGRLFLICTKAPYGLAVVLGMNLGKGQAQNLRERLHFEGRWGRRSPQKRHLAMVRDLNGTVLSCPGIYMKTVTSR